MDREKSQINAQVAHNTLQEIDAHVRKGTYLNRSDFARQAIKEKLQRLANAKKEEA